MSEQAVEERRGWASDIVSVVGCIRSWSSWSCFCGYTFRPRVTGQPAGNWVGTPTGRRGGSHMFDMRRREFSRCSAALRRRDRSRRA